MDCQVAILAAGLGTRLGTSLPKPLTPLRNGESILRRQVRTLRTAFGADADITVVVGFEPVLIMEAIPDVRFIYNEHFDRTNTSKSLLKVLERSRTGGVLWTNGDVVFDPRVLEHVERYLRDDRSFVCVNTGAVGDEEVKYTLDERHEIAQLSKRVEHGLGEAVGINYVSSSGKDTLRKRLEECDDQDYFERGVELAIARDHQRWAAVDISPFACVEVDVMADLDAANGLLAVRER